MPTTPLEYTNSQTQPLAIGVRISFYAHNFVIVILKNRYAPSIEYLKRASASYLLIPAIPKNPLDNFLSKGFFINRNNNTLFVF